MKNSMVVRILRNSIYTTHMSPLPWHEVERAIINEEHWLNNVFDFGPYEKDDSALILPNLSNDKMLRQIAIRIVNGAIQAKEIRTAIDNCLWTESNTEETMETSERHGGYWHRSMMGIVKQHFIETGFEVVNEPLLSLGRADLGIYKEGHPDLFVEIGTTSLFKTWFNTNTMLGAKFLFVPTTTCAIELRISKGVGDMNF